MRKWWIGLLAVLLVLGGALLPLLFPRSSKVTRANFDRIEMGMSRAEVEALFGGPPGDYRTRPVTISRISTWSTSISVLHAESWSGDEGDAVIYFDGGGVRSMQFVEADSVAISPMGLVLWRLGRIRDRCFGSGAHP
jgi:hypothetical protein